jgi:hypothetical protein
MSTLASPWTITLYDWSHKLLDMGKDASIIKEATLSYNNFTKIVLEPPMKYIKEGHELTIKSSQGQGHINVNVRNIIENAIVVEGDYSSYKDWIVSDNHSQVHVIIEHK